MSFFSSWAVSSFALEQKKGQGHRYVSSPHTEQAVRPFVVVAADGLFKKDVFSLPDPFAVITVDAEQTHTTSVIKKTLNPYWNESFDITVKDSSVVAVQIFDQRKFQRQDQGFLGVVNVRVSDVLDLGLDYCHGTPLIGTCNKP
ncbi:C2 domain-containing protein [Mycena sanguinolenta]|nr:C2 domain-containing protein [Mycena sanguinolenta]